MAVIWGTPDRGKLASEEHLVAVFAELVRSVNSSHVVGVKESFADVLAEYVSGASGRDAEARFVSFGVTPHEVCEGAFMRNFLDSLNLFNVAYLMNGRRETTMNGKDLVVDDGRNREVIKDIREHLPNPLVSVFLKALRLETIDGCDLPCFMISADQTDSIWVPQFVKHQ